MFLKINSSLLSRRFQWTHRNPSSASASGSLGSPGRGGWGPSPGGGGRAWGRWAQSSGTAGTLSLDAQRGGGRRRREGPPSSMCPPVVHRAGLSERPRPPCRPALCQRRGPALPGQLWTSRQVRPVMVTVRAERKEGSQRVRRALRARGLEGPGETPGPAALPLSFPAAAGPQTGRQRRGRWASGRTVGGWEVRRRGG